MTSDKHDKLFNSSPRIKMSASAWYHFPKTAYPIAELIQKTESAFRGLLDFHEDTTFRVTAIRKRTKHGQYWSKLKTVELDCRLPLQTAIQTLAHELVHAEQYHQGRLVASQSAASGDWNQYWNGEHVKVRSGYKAYRALPWEMEAFDREAELADKVIAQLGLTFEQLV
jgi:hypothetical protein